jgi:hypothetical protein
MIFVRPIPLTDRFAMVIEAMMHLIGLRAVLAYRAAPGNTLTPLLTLVSLRMRRMRNRLRALAARWRTGKLPKPRPSRAGKPRKCSPRGPLPKLPRGWGWLTRHVVECGQLRTQLENILADEDMATLLREAPQAGRILRPLCRMLGLDRIPEPLRPAKPKPRRPRPGPPRQPRTAAMRRFRQQLLSPPRGQKTPIMLG